MSASAAQCEIGSLLEMSGARPRGNRHDCPQCGGLRTLTHSEEAFYCHRCQWKGNAVTLQKELGIYQRIPSAEYRLLRHNRERADKTAQALYGRVKARRFELLGELHRFNRLELQAHEAGPDHPARWGALALLYRERPAVLAELTFLENAGAVDLLRFLSAGPEERGIDGVLMRGGLCDSHGRFVELEGL